MESGIIHNDRHGGSELGHKVILEPEIKDSAVGCGCEQKWGGKTALHTSGDAAGAWTAITGAQAIDPDTAWRVARCPYRFALEAGFIQINEFFLMTGANQPTDCLDILAAALSMP